MKHVIHRWLLLALGAVLLAGCSALRLSYRQADTILAWRANDYFDLDAQQKQDLGNRLDRLLDWHRYQQLPEYAAFFSAAVAKARPGLKHDDITWFVDGFKARYRVVANYAARDMAELLATITPEQITALQKEWGKVNRKFAREHKLKGTLEERKQARLERTIDQIQDWTGSLTYEQEQKVAALLEPIPFMNPLRHQDRIRRQKEFLELLKLRANVAEFLPKLRAWLLDWESGRAPEYEQLLGEIYERRIQFYITVDKLLTPGQRQIALHRMQDFAADFRALSERPTQRAASDPAAR